MQLGFGGLNGPQISTLAVQLGSHAWARSAGHVTHPPTFSTHEHVMPSPQTPASVAPQHPRPPWAGGSPQPRQSALTAQLGAAHALPLELDDELLEEDVDEELLLVAPPAPPPPADVLLPEEDVVALVLVEGHEADDELLATHVLDEDAGPLSPPSLHPTATSPASPTAQIASRMPGGYAPSARPASPRTIPTLTLNGRRRDGRST